MSQLTTTDRFLSRIDRSVADNITDIQKSFGEDAPIVMDFIIFISKRLKENFFGYAKFTLSDFAESTGWNKQDLCAVHPYFIRNPKAEPPEYYGHVFKTVFDYSLYQTLQKNIIFSKHYSYSSNKDERQIRLENFPILKDIKLNINRKSNAIKIYDIRASDQMIQGFINRYYTLETNGYKLVGKGKGGNARKKLYITIYKTRHLLITQQLFKTRFACDYLCKIAEIKETEPRFKKRAVERILKSLKDPKKGNIPFKYDWVKNDPANKAQEAYWVEVDFFVDNPAPELSETRGDNKFFHELYKNLREFYESQYKKSYRDEKDAFQKWLNSSYVDVERKGECLIKAYFLAYNQNISKHEANEKIREGLFSSF